MYYNKIHVDLPIINFFIHYTIKVRLIRKKLILSFSFTLISID